MQIVTGFARRELAVASWFPAGSIDCVCSGLRNKGN